MICDHGKFSIAEVFSSPNGKTSPGIFCGVMMCLTGCIGFIVALCEHEADQGTIALGFATGGASLLGIRRFTPDKTIPDKPAECK